MAEIDVANLIATLNSVGTDTAQRLDLVAALRRSLYRVQTPFERIWDMMLAEPLLYAAVKTAMDLGLWKAWAKHAGGASMSIDELAKLCDHECDPNLLRRLFLLLFR